MSSDTCTLPPQSLVCVTRYPGQGTHQPLNAAVRASALLQVQFGIVQMVITMLLL